MKKNINGIKSICDDNFSIFLFKNSVATNTIKIIKLLIYPSDVLVISTVNINTIAIRK